MDISLITEGTYPFVHGGVSVWCDQLVRGMAPHTFHIDAISVTGMERPVWELPDNVSSLRQVPLWGPTSIRHPARWLEPRIASALETFLRSITSSTCNGSEFLSHLRILHEFAQQGKLQPALLTEDAVELMLASMTAHTRQARPVACERPRPTVADAVAALILLEHLLRPLSASIRQVDLCHASTNGLGMLLAMAGKWEHGTPLLLTEHGVYLRERYIANSPESMPHPQRAFLLSFFKCLTAAGYEIADVITPCTEYNRLWEQANGAAPEKIHPIYNGINALNFVPPTTEPDYPTIVWVGRIDPLKDVKTLLRAFSRVLQRIPNAKLRIFAGVSKGNESYYRDCLNLHEKLGLGESAVFEGHVASVSIAYHAAHVVLATSISEAFPYAVIEAMASGRAIIATAVGGVHEAIGDTGLLVPPRDDRAMAEACVQLLTDPERRARLASAGRQRVLSRFTLDLCLARYGEVYDALNDGIPIPRADADVPAGVGLPDREHALADAR